MSTTRRGVCDSAFWPRRPADWWPNDPALRHSYSGLGRLEPVDLAGVSEELYGLNPAAFIVARDARISEARQAGDRELADALKKLRKPSTGAWLANRLSREQPSDVERLIGLGEALRSTRNLDGEQIRSASIEKQDVVVRLLRQARSIAKRERQSVSESTALDVEATLDAAFSDPSSAQSFREGCLTTGLHYSGLGFGPDSNVRTSTARSRDSDRAKPSPQTAKAKHDLEHAQNEAALAAAEVQKAQRAVTAAEADLNRLRAALSVATRRATRADKMVSRAQEKLKRDHPRGT